MSLKNADLVAEWQKVVCDGEGCWPGTDTRYALAIFLVGLLRKSMSYVPPMICRNSLQATNRDWFFFDARAATGGFAWPVTRAAKNSGKYVRLAIKHVRVVVAAFSNKPNVSRHIGVRRACPLTIDDLVVVPRVRNICRSHSR